MKTTIKEEYASHKDAIMQAMPKALKTYFSEKKYKLLEQQKEVIRDYYLYLVTEKTAIQSITTYTNKIRKICYLAAFCKKPFNEITKEDLKAFFYSYHAAGKRESTINSFRLEIRYFFQFLYGNETHPLISWIKIGRIQSQPKTEEELISRKELRQMLNHAENSRDRAILAVLYDSAARRGEFLSMKIKHVLPDKYGFRIKLPESKTKDRIIRLIDSAPYLQEWLNFHPNSLNPDAALWIGFCNRDYGSPLSKFGLNSLVSLNAKRAGLAKNVYPHLLRHSRLNQLAKDGYNERDLRLFAGWSDDSKMPKIYLHYGEKELDNKLLKDAGILNKEDSEKEQEEAQALKPQVCSRCNEVNNASNKFCFKCGLALGKESDILGRETENRLSILMDIMQDKELSRKFKEFLENS